MCRHTPRCPAAEETDAEAAHVVASHPEQGWSRLCNGLIVFDDLGALLPDGRARAGLISARGSGERRRALEAAPSDTFGC
jgi:hypothetical protein